MAVLEKWRGRDSYYTAAEMDRVNNPRKYYGKKVGGHPYTWNAQHKKFIEEIEAKAASRRRADLRVKEAIPTSYASFGTGGTNPVFSFSGFAGQTSDAFLGPADQKNLTQAQYENGGVVEQEGIGRVFESSMVEPIQYNYGGAVTGPSPYADSFRAQGMSLTSTEDASPSQEIMAFKPGVLQPVIAHRPPPQQGIGGLFQNLDQNKRHSGMQMMQAQMGGAPLKVYGDYLNNIYTVPEAESSQAQVSEFIDMVDQAERAHFGAEESFGYGGGSYQQGLMSQYQQNIPQPAGGGQKTQGPDSFYTTQNIMAQPSGQNLNQTQQVFQPWQ